MMSHKSRRIALLKVARIFDLATVTATFFVAFAVAAGAFTWPSLIDVFALRIALINVFLFAGYLALCSVICTSCGFYRSHRLSRRSRRVVESLVAATLMAAIIFALRRPFNLSFATDMFLILFWGLTCTSLAVFHLIAQQLLYYARSHGRNLRGIVIVGEGQEAAALADRIGKDTALGYRVLRIIDAKEVGER